MPKAIHIVLVVVFALLAVMPVAAQYYHIDFKNFPEDEGFRRQVSDFFSIYKYVSAWTPEWKHGLSKEKAIADLESLLARTRTHIAAAASRNADLLLFRGLLRHCLYNLDADDQHDRLVKELEEVKSAFPRDYRIPWLLANHLIHAGLFYEGIRQYDSIFQNIPWKKVDQDVALDYCAATYMVMMPATCLTVMNALARDNKIADPQKEFPIYGQVKNMLKEPPVGVPLSQNEVFAVYEREGGNGFLCRLFGVWLPVKPSWSFKLLDVNKTSSGGFAFALPLEADNGRQISASIAGLFQARSQGTFDNYISLFTKGLKEWKPVQGWEGTYQSRTIEFFDADSYKENGGAHGMMVFIKRFQPGIKGVAIEAPGRIPRGKAEGPAYYSLSTGYTRFDGDIYYLFLLDSCEAVFGQAKKEFFEFLDKVRLD